MNPEISLKEDMHVHSTYSDGVNTLEENIAQAELIGLERICCVDHVRRDTVWLNDFADNIEKIKRSSPLEIFSGIETKLLNSNGDLDMPDDVSMIDYLYVADHQFPLADGCYHPKEIRRRIREDDLRAEEAIIFLVEATLNAMRRFPNVVIAHLFSILPKAGLHEEMVSEKLLEELAKTAKRFNVIIEIDERWKCPAFRTVSYFKSCNVPVRFSSDSHRKETIGQYSYNREIYEQLL